MVGLKMGRIVGLAAVSALLGVLLLPTSAHATCTEYGTWIQNVAGTNMYYGDRGAVGSYDHLPICAPGGAVASTIFVSMENTTLDYFEKGVVQADTDTSGYAHIFTEWRLSPYSDYHWDDAEFGRATTNRWYSFMVRNTEGGTGGAIWGASFSGSSDPDTATWSALTTAYMPRQVGTAESEVSVYGTGDAFGHIQRLETQNRYASPWSAWTNPQCPDSAPPPGYNAVKCSNQRWKHEISSTGLCP